MAEPRAPGNGEQPPEREHERRGTTRRAADRSVHERHERGEREGEHRALDFEREAGTAGFVTPARTEMALRRVAWGALFGGLIIGLIIQLTLGMLGVAIGASTIDPLQGDIPAAGLGIGSAIWWLVSTLVALFAGGWAAARLAGVPRKLDGVLHGLITWGLLMLVMFMLVGTVLGSVVGGAFGALGRTLGLAAQGVAASVPQQGGAPQDVRSQAEQELGPAGQAEGLQRAFDELFTEEGVTSQSAQDAAVEALVAQGIPEAEARARVEQWSSTFQQAQEEMSGALQGAEQQMREIGEQISNALTVLAAWLFAALVLGGGAAALGGALGARRVVPLSELHPAEVH